MSSRPSTRLAAALLVTRLGPASARAGPCASDAAACSRVPEAARTVSGR
ncbi:hypothetical protein [Microvirga sesbaniae]|nr:hypothetical protein [Microvirga sp. HBU67692]